MLFVAYDTGNIRDVDRFAENFEALAALAGGNGNRPGQPRVDSNSLSTIARRAFARSLLPRDASAVST
jgi:hypothetical protein